MSKVIASEVLAASVAAEFGEGPRFTVEVFAAAGGGYVYSYANAVQGHDVYGDAAGEPFATVEAALAVARDPASENVAEFGGDLA